MGGGGVHDGDSEDMVKRTTRRAKRTAERVAEDVSDAAAAAAEEAREAARGIGAEMRDAAESLVDEQKARLAQMAQGFAHALRRSAEAFAEEGGTAIAHCADRVADQVEDLSNTVRTQTWRDMLATAEGAARRRPELFLAGVVAAGFIVGRMLGGSGTAET